MLILPAIDLKDGKCVRLQQGEMDKETVFYDSPTTAAKKWEEKGAQMIHIVDLNGAISGAPQNFKYIEDIISSINIPIQVGGGIRTIDAVEAYISLGVKRIIMGTSAIKNISLIKKVCKKYPEKIIIGVDAKNGLVATEGWVETSEKKVDDCIRSFGDLGLAGIIYTDISKDGMMKGPNIESIKKVAELSSTPIIASGGISCIDDVKKIIKLEKHGVSGMIIGRALYAGAIPFEEAMKLSQNVN